MISIKKLNLQKDKKTVLSIDSIDLFPGKKYVVLGPNGSGKSFLLSNLHSTKKVIYPEDKKNRVKSILINNYFALFDDITVWDNLIFGIKKLSKTKKEILISLTKKIGLFKFLEIKTKLLPSSYGKLVELTRAVFISPYLLLIDDIDKYFDDSLNLKALNLLFFACQNGVTIFSASHSNQMESDKVFVIRNQRLTSQS